MKNQVILFQGDSITDCGRARDTNVPNTGLGAGYPFLSAAHLLCAKAEDGLKIFNRGISGNRIVDLYARWKVDGLNLNPDVISILIGVNDTWHEFGSKNGVEIPRFEQFYRMLLEWTVQARPGVKLVLCEPFVFVCGAVGQDWVPEINQRREVVRKMAKEFDTIFIPYQEIFDAALKRAPAEYWLGDGVHPTYAGHQLMAAAWMKAADGII
jgi:lysophospholipase L1-like esterase